MTECDESRFRGRYRALIAGGIALACMMVGACQPPPKTASAPAPTTESTGEDQTMTVPLTSPAFAANAAVPAKYTGDGEDISPALNWLKLPAGTKELALICDDPDAPSPEPWVHWVIYRIPAEATGLPENVAKTESPAVPAGAVQGKNSWGRTGYGGPAPPRGHGVHHYHFQLYALNRVLDAPPGLDKAGLLRAMQGAIIGQGKLTGTYQR